MAHGHLRARSVLVRLCSMTSRLLRHSMTRRLLVLGAIAVAGWLLGGTGQAHAETETAPGSDLTGAVVSTAPDGSGGPAGIVPEAARSRLLAAPSVGRAGPSTV